MNMYLSCLRNACERFFLALTLSITESPVQVLQKLSEDKLEINEESGEVTIADPKKIRGLGFVDFPARAIISAIQAGVPVVSVQIPFSIADRSHAATLAVCREYNLKVLARDGLLGGIISEKFLGAPEPESTQPDADLDDVTHSLELVNNYGGWEKVQNLLQVIKSIADKHGESCAPFNFFRQAMHTPWASSRFTVMTTFFLLCLQVSRCRLLLCGGR